MFSPYGLDIVESCLTCKMRAEHVFCDLPPVALRVTWVAVLGRARSVPLVSEVTDTRTKV
jgi:hypothetical protein